MSTFEPAPSEDALRDLREPSPFPADGGELIGKHPRKCLRRCSPCPQGKISAEGPSGAMSGLLLRFRI